MVILPAVSAAAFDECQEVGLLEFPPASVTAQAAVGRKAVTVAMCYRFLRLLFFSVPLHPVKHVLDFILNSTFKHFFIHYDSPSLRV